MTLSNIIIQFHCKNGRIVLNLNNHEWSASDTSLNYCDVTNKQDFISKWNDSASPSASGSDVSVRSSTTQQLTSSASCLPPSSSSHSQSASSRQLQNSPSMDDPPPAKRGKYLKDTLDVAIENCKAGNFHKADT